MTPENLVNHLEILIDHEPQYERRHTLVFMGENVLDDSFDENCKLNIHELITQDLELGYVNLNHISTVHRSGRQREGQNIRNIMVKPCRRDLVRDIYKQYKTIKSKCNIKLREVLLRENAVISKKCELKKNEQ